MSVPESEWNEHERALMIALDVWRAGQCPRCGGDLAETTNPLHDRDNSAGTHYYRRATKPRRCHRCTALMESERQHSSSNVPHPAACAHFVELVPRTRPAARGPRKPKQPPVLSEEQQRRRARRATKRK